LLARHVVPCLFNVATLLATPCLFNVVILLIAPCLLDATSPFVAPFATLQIKI
jgi:hypothetical protein